MLRIDGVSKRYGTIAALSRVSFTVNSGEIVALVGENGAGKSSLVRCIARSVTPDEGRITIDGEELGRSPRDAIDQGLAVVWQDLALCENLDVTANLFLGRELVGRTGLRRAEMRAATRSILAGLGVSIPDVDQTLDRLSGGQRQVVAIARATLERPRVLVLDEPTAALSVAESSAVLAVVRRLQASGVAVVMVSHHLDDVFDVADRIVVLRHGRLVADVHRSETHPDDVIALITGTAVETMAGQQLRRLHSLAEQLAGAERSNVLPLTVSSLSAALSVDKLAIFLAEQGPGGPRLRHSAGLHLPPALEEGLSVVPIGDGGGFLGRAAELHGLQIVPDLADEADDPAAGPAIAGGVVGAWAAPIVGQRSCVAVIAGFTDGVAQLQPDQIQLLELFSTMAGAAIERGQLVETLRSRNRSLSGLQAVIQALAGPELLAGALTTALDELCVGIDLAFAVLLLENEEGALVERAASSRLGPALTRSARRTVADALSGGVADPSLHLARFTWSRGVGVVVCLTSDAPLDPEGRRVADGAANSFRLALERELAVEAEREATALQRSRAIERALTRRLGHELRTPLTAIRGFASTMLQPDVSWGDDDKQRFLEIIESEAGRMGRLVAQLFDDSALETGTLRLDVDYCDLVAIIDRAISVSGSAGPVRIEAPSALPVWGDRDRLQQVLVNLIDNALRHNAEGTAVVVTAGPSSEPDRVRVTVADDGDGLPDDVLDYLNGDVDQPLPGRGLGVRLARGFVHAHGGMIGASSGPGGSVISFELQTEGRQP